MSCRKEHFLPIESYGVIGNCRTIALVSSSDGSIDHLAFPHFDSPLVFGRLLTRQGGGFFEISPADCHSQWTSKQLYLPSSNVLVTKYLGAKEGIGQVTDFMPVAKGDERKCETLTEALVRKAFEEEEVRTNECSREAEDETAHRASVRGWPWVVRRVETVRGTVKYSLCCQPAFNFGRVSHSIRRGEEPDTFLFESPVLTLQLCASISTLKEAVAPIRWSVQEETVAYECEEGLTVSLPRLVGEFELREYQSVYFVLREPGDGETARPSPELLSGLLVDTNAMWRDWLHRCTYRGRWRETVQRSALALKLMTFAPTGAIIAAPTTSLPEVLGDSMNFDYRYVWLRDAAFTVYAFLRIGLTEEAKARGGLVLILFLTLCFSGVLFFFRLLFCHCSPRTL